MPRAHPEGCPASTRPRERGRDGGAPSPRHPLATSSPERTSRTNSMASSLSRPSALSGASRSTWVGEPARESAAEANGHGDRPGEVPRLTVGLVVEPPTEATTAQPVAATGCRVGQPERPTPHPGRMPQLREEPPARVPTLGESIDRFCEGGAGVHHVTVWRPTRRAHGATRTQAALRSGMASGFGPSVDWAQRGGSRERYP